MTKTLEDHVLQFVTAEQAIEVLSWEIRKLNRTLKFAKSQRNDAKREMELAVETPSNYPTIDECVELYWGWNLPKYDSDGLPR